VANAAALINEGLWRKDRDFQKLPRSAQCTYCQVLSQKDLDTAGGLTLHLELMAKGCEELTTEQLLADLAILEERRFIFVDYNTDELLVRSYARLVSGNTTRNLAWKSVPKNARMIASPKLRRELAVELRRLRRRDATELADEIDPDKQPPSDPLNPLGTPLENTTPLEGGPNPHSSVLVPVLVSPSVVGLVGEGPRPHCNDHEENSTEPCRTCQQRREWDELHEALAELDELDTRRRQRQSRAEAIANCPVCDENGNRELDDDTLTRCDRHA
jgi:hypothetical protein